jgi:hypothetical protein
VSTAKAMLVAGSVIAFCAALLFARAETPNATVSTGGSAASSASDGSLYDGTYGDSFSQGGLSGSSAAPQVRTGAS